MGKYKLYKGAYGQHHKAAQSNLEDKTVEKQLKFYKLVKLIKSGERNPEALKKS